MKKPRQDIFDGVLIVVIVGMVLILVALIHDIYTGVPSI